MRSIYLSLHLYMLVFGVLAYRRNSIVVLGMLVSFFFCMSNFVRFLNDLGVNRKLFRLSLLYFVTLLTHQCVDLTRQY